MFGIFAHRTLQPLYPIFRGFDDVFYVPHSRHTEVRKEDILKVPGLTLLSESEEAGVYMVMARNGREFFVTGHSEYSPLTLDTEYRRDLAKGLPIEMPRNYYVDDNPDKGVSVRWRAHANLLFSNWLNYLYIRKPRSILKKLNKNSENLVGSCAPFCGERNMMKQRKIELLAPAKNLECGIEAVNHGADAVYIGAPKFGARAAAVNSLEDIAALVAYAHLYNVRIYVTVNTILKKRSLPKRKR